MAIEVCHSKLHLAVWQQTERETVSIVTRSMSWRSSSSTEQLHLAVDDLVTAMKQLVTDHSLQGQPVHLALTGDYCVTRVVTGTVDHVRHELSDLKQRSNLYLSLGHGQKTLAGSVGQTDARHQHALLSVVNQKTLDALAEVARRVGVELQWMEPSLVALCRLVGHMGADTDSPALIVNVGERGVELGISHRGQLLLDYRPAGLDAHSQVAAVVQHHLGRLERYCARYVGIAKGRLERVFLCGEAEAVEVVRAAIESRGELPVEVLDPPAIDASWTFDEAVPGTEMTAALGTCLLNAGGEKDHNSPNLMEQLQASNREALLSALARTCWPFAVAVLVAAVAWAMAWRAHAVCADINSEIAQFDPQMRKIRILAQTTERDQIKRAHLERLRDGLNNPDWDGITTVIGHCLPADVWLDSISVDSAGKVHLKGGSYSDDGVFEFIAHLERSPSVHRVALTGTQPSRSAAGPATRFDIQAALAGRSDQEEQANDGV